jgi:hypothetical protein
MEIATPKSFAVLTNQINKTAMYPFICSRPLLHTLGVTAMTTFTMSTNQQQIFCSTSARCKVRPRARILIIPRASFADNPFTYVHKVAFEMI